MNHFDLIKISEVLARGYDENQNPDILGVIYSLGRDAENEEEYDFAFQTLLNILENGTERVRAYCILGFSLLAVFHKKLDRAIVEPIIIAERKVAKGDNLATINDAIEDIKVAMKWQEFD